jgi:hypothetical protein
MNPDKNYQKKIQEVKLIVAEVECVNAIQTQIEFANKHIMRSAMLTLTLDAQ